MFLDSGPDPLLTSGISKVASFAGTDNRAGNAMGVLFLFLFVTFYGGSQDASSYVYCSEIFPTGVRAQGLSIAIATLFGSTLLYTEVAPIAFASIGWKYVKLTGKLVPDVQDIY